MIATAIAEPETDDTYRPRPRLTLVSQTSSPSRTVRVLVTGGSTLVRAAFRALLENGSDLTVAGEAGTADEAVELTRRTRADVVLMCLELQAADSIDAIKRITSDSRHPRAQVIVLTASDDGDQAVAALRAGASGFLPLDTDPAELVQAMRVVARGDAFLSPAVTRSLIAELTSQPAPDVATPEQLEELTAREREVMALAAGGLSNEEIGEHLVVSPATAKTHVCRAMMKLQARDRSQLVALAYRTGLVRPRTRPAAPAPSTRPALALV